jgi:hypothetical protein
MEYIDAETSFAARIEFAKRHKLVVTDCMARVMVHADTITAPAVATPAAPALTANQIAWAKQHDWFYAVNPRGQIIVFDRYTKNGQHFEDTIVWTAGFRALRDWAGY